MTDTRRHFLLRSLLGAGALGLRALATGLPLSVLVDPRRALADPPDEPVPPQFVILATSADGDPLNCNAPGAYADPGVVHPDAPAMAPTPLTLGGQTVTAARPWSLLPRPLLDRTCFFHHATYSVVHSDQPRVMALGGASTSGEMFASLLAAQLAPRLGTVQPEPVVLGPRDASEGLVYQGNPQPILSPSALSLLLGAPRGPLGDLTALRARDLDRVHALLRACGSPAQAAFIDRYVRSQAQLRSLSESLLTTLGGIRDDSLSSQIRAAVTLIRMNVSPVISLHIPFGGDNHGDYNLQQEASESVRGVAALGELWSALAEHELHDRVTFLSLNVFGRTMSAAQSTNGRAHNANHQVSVMFGRGLRGSVVGGVEPMAGDYGASSIDPTTGRAVRGGRGAVPFEDTFAAMAHTFGRAVGVSPSVLGDNLLGGAPVTAALAHRG